MTLPMVAPSRQAALLLRSLGDADQRWVLSALPTHQQVELRNLLQELQDLGIPQDRQMVSSLLSNTTQVGSQLSSPSKALLTLEQLQPREIRALALLFNSESAGLVAKVLDLQEWTWRDALLQQLNAGQQTRVRARLAALRRERTHSSAPNEVHIAQGGSKASLAFEQAVRRLLTTAITESLRYSKDIDSTKPTAWTYWQNAFNGVRRHVYQWFATAKRRVA